MPENLLSTENASHHRIVSLDVIKILSAFMVVFYHFRYMDPGHFKGGSYVMSAPQFLLCFCSASIPMFFMVNGALMLNKNRSVQEIYRKAGRLALVSLVWNRLVGFYTWFFYALIVLYLLYPIFIRAFNAENRIYLYLIMAAVFVMPFMYNFVVLLLERFCPDFSFIFFGQTISLKTIPLRTGVHRLYSILYFLLGGVLLNKRVSPILSLSSIILGQAITVWDVIVTSNYTGKIADAVNSCFPTVGGLLLAFGFFTLLRVFDCVDDPKATRLLASFGGEGVLMVYLLHVRIRTFLSAAVLPPTHRYSIFVILCVSAAVCVFCWLVSQAVKRIPLLKELIKL